MKKLLHPFILSATVIMAYLFFDLGGDTQMFLVAVTLAMTGFVALLEYFAYYEQRSLPNKTEMRQYLVFFLMTVMTASLVERLNHVFYPAKAPTALGWVLGAEILLALVLSEFGFYWYHRLCHQIPFLWRIHKLHHSVDKVNVGNYFFLHPLDTIFFKIFCTLPLIFIGFSDEAIFITLVFQQTQKLLMHSNTGAPLRLLNYFLISAELHRMHHSKDLQEVGNYGGVLSLWDLVFGTFKTRESVVPIEYGIEEQAPSNIRQMLVYPIKNNETASQKSGSVDVILSS